MYFDIGNRQRIDDPTPEQIRHYLRNLPADAPFIILNADEEHFIQAIPAGALFRVEWRQEAQHRFMLVPLDRAEESFMAFRRWDEAGLKAFAWQRLGLFNDPYRRVVIVACVFLAVALICLWSALR
jgi:hypothetical protein